MEKAMQQSEIDADTEKRWGELERAARDDVTVHSTLQCAFHYGWTRERTAIVMASLLAEAVADYRARLVAMVARHGGSSTKQEG
jgi:hypothetical protein